VGAAAGVELEVAAGAEAESGAADFLDFEVLPDFVEPEASAAGVEGAELPEASAVSAFLDLEDFLVVEASAAALSAVSGFLDFEVDFLAEEASTEVLSALSDFLDFADDFFAVEESSASDGLDLEDFLVEVESAEASSVDFFFFLVEVESAEASSVDFFFFLVELESVWSVDCEDCAFATARREKLPARSSEATNKAGNIGLREIVISGKSFRRKESPPEGHMGESAAGRVAGGVKVPSRAAVRISE